MTLHVETGIIEEEKKTSQSERDTVSTGDNTIFSVQKDHISKERWNRADSLMVLNDQGKDLISQT